jgi:hypothetical protein
MKTPKHFDHSLKKKIFKNVKPVTKIPNSQILTACTADYFTHVCTFIWRKIPADVRNVNEKVRVKNALWYSQISKIGAVLT